MNKSVLFILFAIICLSMNAQDEKAENLIQNPSFENDNGKIKKLGYAGKSLGGWTTATKTKADVFTPSSIEPSAGVPNNDMGKANAKDGDNYIGLKLYDYNAKGGRSYLTSALTDHLEKDKRYCLTYSISLADVSKYASNNFGVYFSKKEVYEEDKDVLLRTDGVVLPMNNLVQSDMNKWTTVCMPFTAKGFEKFITLGNFHSVSKTATETVKKPKGIPQSQIAMSYYFIDDMNLVKIDRDSECTCKEEKLIEGPKIIYSQQSVLQANASVATRINSTKIYFYSLKTDLVTASESQLSKLADILISKPSLKIEILGHSDETEETKLKTEDDYVNLSEARAESAKAYLVDMGVPESQLTVKNFKATKPTSKMKTPISLAKNRRVAFKMM